MQEVKPVGADPTGYEYMKRAVRALLNSYPGLGEQTIYFEELGKEDGIAFSSDTGALVISERRSITDHITQNCQFPFMVVYRTTATREHEQLRVAAFLDSIGKWLCKEPVEIGGKIYRLDSYPIIADGRKIIRVTRNNSYGTVPGDNNIQDWVLPVSIQYTYEFDL